MTKESSFFFFATQKKSTQSSVEWIGDARRHGYEAAEAMRTVFVGWSREEL